MRLRRVPIEQKEDFWTLFQVYQEELSPHSGNRPGSGGDYPYVYWHLYWSEPESRFPYIIVQDDTTAGLLLLRHCDRDDLGRKTHSLQVAEFFILPAFRGSGLAEEVLLEVARRAEAQGRRVTWSCYQSNVRALGLYNKVLRHVAARSDWSVEREAFIDVTRRSRYFYSLIPPGT